MTNKAQDSNTQSEPQPDNVHPLPEPFKYDAEHVETFISTVFRDLRPDEHVLAWAAASRPGYPSPAPELLGKLRRSARPLALYYGTSTASPDPDDGKLYNRKALCVRTHVVVLDDIGTKVPKDRLPEDLEQGASYIIETSPGNFQYGYVLAKPIEDTEAAGALVQLLYNAGLSDAGGALANKLVRLPDGVNGKPGPHQSWRVKLHHLEADPAEFWTPQELLDAAGLKVKWQEVLDDSRKVMLRTSRHPVTPWTTVVPMSPNLDGNQDPALEWLYAHGHVAQEVGDWVTIRCPWADQHTTGGESAGYSPLGRGEGVHAISRGFHCFHEHCRDRHARDLLEWIEAQGGPALPSRDYTGPLHAHWTYDPADDLAYPIALRGHPMASGVGLSALRRLYPQKAPIPGDKNARLRSVVDIWVESPHRVVTHGITSDPTTPGPISGFEGVARVNTFKVPEYRPVEQPQLDADVATFLQFLAYLIPDDEERQFFIDWLTAKVQDQSFRGPAILMTTPVQGTGRTTLGGMVSTLLGVSNSTTLSYDQLVGGQPFNDWQLHTLVICNEVYQGRGHGPSGLSFYRGYERLKALIDFQPVMTTINVKNKKARPVPVFSSYLLFSNHHDALPLDASDRRFYVMRNTVQRETPAYFTALNKWLVEDIPERGALPRWACSVASWMRGREIDPDALKAPAVLNESKLEVILASRSTVDELVDHVIDAWQGDYISVAAVESVLCDGHVNIMATQGVGEKRALLRRQIGHSLERVAVRVPHKHIQRVRISDTWPARQHTMWPLRKLSPEEHKRAARGKVPNKDLKKAIEQHDFRKLVDAVMERL